MRVIDAVKETIADVSIVSPSSERRRANARNVSYVLVSFTASITSSEHSFDTPTNKQTSKQANATNPTKEKNWLNWLQRLLPGAVPGLVNRINKRTNKQANREVKDWAAVPWSSGSTSRVTWRLSRYTTLDWKKWSESGHVCNKYVTRTRVLKEPLATIMLCARKTCGCLFRNTRKSKILTGRLESMSILHIAISLSQYLVLDGNYSIYTAYYHVNSLGVS